MISCSVLPLPNLSLLLPVIYNFSLTYTSMRVSLHFIPFQIHGIFFPLNFNFHVFPLFFPLVVVYSLPLSPLPLVHSKYLYFFEENCIFLCHISKFLLPIFSCPLKFPASPFLLNIISFLFVSSKLFINLKIIISLLFFFCLQVC